MESRRFLVEMLGQSPLILHQDSVEWSDRMDKWKDNANNRKDSKAGDDRYPAWRWIGSLYHDGELVGIPTEVLLAALRNAASSVPMPGGKGGKSFKSESVSGMAFVAPYASLETKRGDSWTAIPATPVTELIDDRSKDYDAHKSVAAKIGMELDIRRVTIGKAKHVRVRPRFNSWRVTAEVECWDDKLAKALPSILEVAGRRGIGDYRPSAPSKPGPYGRFVGTCKEIKS